VEGIIFIGIAVACIIILIICAIKRRPDLIVNFLLRSSIGTAAICLLDLALSNMGYQMSVGINGITVLTNGLLGLPGFLLLYALSFYYSAGL